MEVSLSKRVLESVDENEEDSKCPVRCSLLSPCLDGWFGDGACDGCVTDGSECVTGTPPGTMPSIAAAMPPGVTPTMPGGNLNTERLKVKP
ncbi:uncharacterized [Tachysurus ichikawai]